MSNITRLWTPNSMFTVEQVLNESLNEVRVYDVSRVLVIGEYKNNDLMIKPSRMSHAEALWLLARAQNNATHYQFEMDVQDNE